jgi:hypothetical protein
MKRTKERFGKLDAYNKEGISGLKVFDGEDLEYQDRHKLQQLQQKTWVEQQKYEKKMSQEQDRYEEKLFAEQTLAINRTRSMLEGEHDQRRKEMNRMQMEYNKQLAAQKKDRDLKKKYDETNLDIHNINEAESTRNNVYDKLKGEIDEVRTFYQPQS